MPRGLLFLRSRPTVRKPSMVSCTRSSQMIRCSRFALPLLRCQQRGHSKATNMLQSSYAPWAFQGAFSCTSSHRAEQIVPNELIHFYTNEGLRRPTMCESHRGVPFALQP